MNEQGRGYGARALGGWMVVMAAIGVAGAPSPARADGDETLGPTLYERAIGLRVASTGVGLASVRGGAAIPVTEGTLTLAGLPDGAVIRHAYLYWQTFGVTPDTEVALDGMPVTGTLIGTGAPTCWDDADTYHLEESPNRTYRADVGTIVDGNGAYVLTGVATGEIDRDGQGASLVVVYVDPTESRMGTVALRDGAMVVTDGDTRSFAFDEIAPVTAVTAELHVGVGDGELVLSDGTVNFGAALSPAAAGLTYHFAGGAGNYWDANVYDLADRLPYVGPGARFSPYYEQDCLAFAYVALVYQSDEAAPDDAGIDASMADAGGADTGGVDSGGLDGGPAIDAGRIDGGTMVETTGGCGCRGAGPGTSWAALGAGVGALLVVRRRRR